MQLNVKTGPVWGSRGCFWTLHREILSLETTVGRLLFRQARLRCFRKGVSVLGFDWRNSTYCLGDITCQVQSQIHLGAFWFGVNSNSNISKKEACACDGVSCLRRAEDTWLCISTFGDLCLYVGKVAWARCQHQKTLFFSSSLHGFQLIESVSSSGQGPFINVYITSSTLGPWSGQGPLCRTTYIRCSF